MMTENGIIESSMICFFIIVKMQTIFTAAHRYLIATDFPLILELVFFHELIYDSICPSYNSSYDCAFINILSIYYYYIIYKFILFSVSTYNKRMSKDNNLIDFLKKRSLFQNSSSKNLVNKIPRSKSRERDDNNSLIDVLN